jgi:hypothetical protein
MFFVQHVRVRTRNADPVSAIKRKFITTMNVDKIVH